jgi:membrane protein required for beta-lactamase induction
MDSKKTLGIGAILLVVGVLLCAYVHGFWHQFIELLKGLVALGLFAAGGLFLLMGYISAKEDAEAAAKEQADAQQQSDMAASA